MKIYVVIKTGVYRHEIVSVRTSQGAAQADGVTAARAEHDAWHHFEIVECVLDEPGERVVAEVKRTDKTHAEGRYGVRVIDSTEIETFLYPPSS